MRERTTLRSTESDSWSQTHAPTMAPEMRTANALLMPKGEDFEFVFVLSTAIIDFLVIFSVVFFILKETGVHFLQ